MSIEPTLQETRTLGSNDQVCKRIKDMLQDYLKESQPYFTETINDDMSFDYLGLDSLSRVNLITRLEKEFGIKLDITAAYDFVTARALAEFVWSTVNGVSLDAKYILED